MSDATLTVTQSLDTLSITTIAGSSLAGGGTVTGPLNIGVDDAGHDVKFFGDTASRYMLWDASDDSLELSDNAKIKLGADGDLQLYHDGSQSRISDTGTGRLTIETDGDSIRLTKGTSENMAIFTPDGSVDLYYNNAKKIETTNDGATVSGSLTVNGGLNVEGTVTSFDSTTVTIDDPVFTIGGDTAPSSDDNKDRGVEFRYHDGSTPRVGFFGYDDSESAFTFLTSATNSSEVFSGTLGNLKVNTVYHADGTASSPSVSFNSDVDTGIFRPTANNIAITAGGSEVIIFDGNLKTTTKGSVRVNGSTTEGIVIASSPLASQGLKLFNNSSTDVASIINHYNGSLILGTANTERLRIHGDGNITIGGTAGQAMLQLEGGDVRVDNTRSFLTETAGGGVISAVSMNSSDNLTFGDGNFVIDVTGTAERMRIDSNGRLGISTAAPLGLLQVDEYTVGSNGSQSIHGVVSVFADSAEDAFFVGLKNGSYPNRGYSFQVVANGVNSDFVIKEHGQTGERIRLYSSGLLQIAGTGGGATTIGSHIDLGDNQKVRLGASDDFTLFHNGTNSNIENATGNLNIINTADDKDITFQCDDGSGGVETYFLCDGSASSGNPIIRFPDNSIITLGTANDFYAFHNGSNTFLQNNTGDLYISNTADDKDIIFQADDGSGGVETYFYLDGSASSGNPFTVFPDLSELAFGDSRDFRIKHTSSDSYISNYTGDLYIRNDATDKDIVFQSDDGSGGMATYFRLDGSASAGNPITNFPDNSFLSFGSSHDFSIYHDSSNTYIANSTNDLYIQNNADNRDIIFRCDDGSGGVETYFYLDGSASSGSPFTVFPDNSKLTFGNGNDLILEHNGADSYISNYTGDLYVRNLADVKDIHFQSDDGSGGTTDYLKISGANNDIRAYKNIKLSDNSKAIFGDGSDLQIFHDGSNSYIKDGGTGNLLIQGADVEIQTVAGNKYFTGSSNVAKLYHTNNEKLATTSDGVQVTGDILAHTASGQYFQVDHSDNSVKLSDNVKLKIGTGMDFQIFHTGTNTTMLDQGTGALVIASNNLRVLSANQSETLFEATEDGAVELYHNNEKKFETTSAGVTITGDALVEDNLYLTDAGTVRGKIQLNSSDRDNLDIKAISLGSLMRFYTVDTLALTLDASQNATFAGDVVVTGDLTINGTTTTIDTANLTVEDKNIIIGNVSSPSDTTADGGGITLKGASDYTIAWNNTSNRWHFNQGIQLDDSKKVAVGSASDASFYHNGTQTYLENATGDLTIRNLSDGDDIIIQTDNGSGGVENYLQFDGGGRLMRAYRNFRVQDDVKLQAGSSGDLEIKHVSNHSYVDNYTGDLLIRNQTNDGNVSLICDNGSGGMAEYFRLDGGLGYSVVSKTLNFSDNVPASFGGGGDLSLRHNGTDSEIINYTGNLILRNNADDKDIVFQSDDGSGSTETYFFLDGSASSGNPVTNFPDNSALTFGNDRDYWIYHDGTNSRISNYVGDLVIRNYADDKDIVFVSDDGSGGIAEYFRLDGGLGYLFVSKTLNFADNVPATFGPSGDLNIRHDGSNSLITNNTGNLNITNATDDGDIIFECDNGSGGLATYFRLDGSESQTRFEKHIKLSDSVELRLGTSNDLKIYHDGSNSYIDDTGTGDLYIRANNLRLSNADGTGQTINANNGGAVELYHNNSKKFQTSSTGATITGNLVMGGGQVKFADSGRVRLGDSNDLDLYHDGTDSYIENETGTLIISNNVDNADIRLQASGGSGSASDYLILDSSQTAVRLKRKTKLDDNLDLCFGDGEDLKIGFDGTNSTFSQTDGNMRFIQYTDDKDIIFMSDDGSGGVTAYLTIDGSGGYMWASKSILLADNISTSFGNSQDLFIKHNGTDSVIENNTGDLYITNKTDDRDIIFQSDDGSGGVTEYFRLDGDSGYTKAHKEIRMDDATPLRIGTGGDARFMHDGNNTYLDNFTGDFYIRQATDDKDLIFQCDDSSGGMTEYFRLDGADAISVFSRTVRHLDTVVSSFGNSDDLRISHNGTDSVIDNFSGDLYISNKADDKDIYFQCDDGSGGVETYFYLDGSMNTDGTPKTVFPDNSKLQFGSGAADLRLYHNGTNSYIENNTGDLRITNYADDKDIIFQSDDGSGGVETYFFLDGSLSGGNPFTIFPDNSRLGIGTSADLHFIHDGTDSLINNTDGNLFISNFANDKSVYLRTDDGSGGIATYLQCRGDREVVQHHRGVEYNTVLSNNSDYTVGSANHVILMHGMSAGRTVNIPAAQCNSGRVLIVKDRDGTAATHNITIATGGSETIDGGATHTISTNRGSVTLISDGSNWFII